MASQYNRLGDVQVCVLTPHQPNRQQGVSSLLVLPHPSDRQEASGNRMGLHIQVIVLLSLKFEASTGCSRGFDCNVSLRVYFSLCRCGLPGYR